MDLTRISLTPLRFRVTFQEADPCFHGHFPDAPVVPGSLIIALCLDCLPRQHSELRVKRFSFPRFARPGTYELSIDQHNTMYHCVFHQGEKIYAQGKIEQQTAAC